MLQHFSFSRAALLFFASMINLCTAFGTEPEQLFAEGNDLYQAGNFAFAAEKYESIASQKVYSKELFYNLGNSYFKLNKIGRAILNYERALLYDHGDAAVLHNLSVAQARLTDDVQPVNDFALVRWWRKTRDLLNADRWSILGFLMICLGFGGLSIWLLAKERQWKKYGFIAGLSAIPLSILLLLLARSSAKELESSFAIVLAAESALKPFPEAPETIATLHEGLKLEILEINGAYAKVKMPNGEQGWIDLKTIEKI